MSTTTAVATLPKSSDPTVWSNEEKALVEAAGLVHTDAQSGVKTLAERPVVAAFLQHCQRTGLDPIARQIYSIARKSKGQLKWQIQISIDGARLVAERSGQYEGQTTPEFTADGTNWTQVWLSSEHPAAARIGVYRRGFREPLYAVALWDAYVQTRDEWVSGRKTGKVVVGDMWAKMGPLMLAKCAEMLALRKAFPQDLSGLYSSEEMAQATPPAEAPAAVQQAPAEIPVQAIAQQSEPVIIAGQVSRDWAALAEACMDMESLRALHGQAEQAQELGLHLPSGQTVGGVLWDRRALFAPMAAPEPDSKPVTLDIPTSPPASAGPTEEELAAQIEAELIAEHEAALASQAEVFEPPLEEWEAPGSER